MADNKIIFTDENGDQDEFFVVEAAKLNGADYLLVTDSEENEADAFIMKNIAPEDSDEAVYVFVEDDDELEAAADVFAELLDDEADLV